MVEGSHRLKCAALVVALAFTAAACAPTGPRPAAEGVPPTASETDGGLSAAGSALLVRSRNERRSGDYARAAASLERALRIEPTAPVIWLELARVRLLEGDVVQAEQLARKAEFLAPPDSALAEESRAVRAEAHRRQ